MIERSIFSVLLVELFLYFCGKNVMQLVAPFLYFSGNVLLLMRQVLYFGGNVL
jgi:hypothetical protein